jgi:hypothetical protein
LITNYIDENYKNIRVRFSNRIEYAAVKGHVNVLEWFKNSEYELKYDESAINKAFQNGHIDVLEWFTKLCKNSGYEFKYDNSALAHADDCVIDWYEKNKQYLPDIMQNVPFIPY